MFVVLICLAVWILSCAVCLTALVSLVFGLLDCFGCCLFGVVNSVDSFRLFYMCLVCMYRCALCVI